MWCPASFCSNGPTIDRAFEFHRDGAAGRAAHQTRRPLSSGIEQATRSGDLRTAVTLATPLYDELFGTPAQAQATAIRPLH